MSIQLLNHFTYKMKTLLIPIIYLAFISLGLPDALLGSAWPVIHKEFHVPLSYAGTITIIIFIGTIISSLKSDHWIQKWGTGKVTVFSVASTALALFGFSFSNSYIMLCLFAIPYGLGAGSVDAALNNFVALHYESKHLSWLHCMWGIGASVGPYIMSAALINNSSWPTGYRHVGFLQLLITLLLFLSLPLWKKPSDDKDEVCLDTLSKRQLLHIPGVKASLLTFFGYCALEQTAGLWASSYLVLCKGIDAGMAARFASLFYIGITIGRFINGFISMKLKDKQMILMGFFIIAIGILFMLLPVSSINSLVGIVIIGVGCAPIYPCLVHTTPTRFDQAYSQSIIGMQMASASLSACIMPPFFGLIANHLSIGLYPVYLAFNLLLMLCAYYSMNKNNAV